MERLQNYEAGARPLGIDLFAGAGGLSLGFEQAGFDVAAAVEIDPVHAAVHKFNFPNTAVLPQSVEGLSAAAIREAAGIGDRKIDCVFGGAPCQGFSMIGHRVLDDPRNKLVLEFVRIVTDLNARTFVFENVKGLTVGKHKRFLAELVEAFDSAGYVVRTPWQVLNAGHYGTPQSRDRLILLGARKGENLPDYPAPQTNMAGGAAQSVPGTPVGANLCRCVGRSTRCRWLSRAVGVGQCGRGSFRAPFGLCIPSAVYSERPLAFRICTRVGSKHPHVERENGAY